MRLSAALVLLLVPALAIAQDPAPKPKPTVPMRPQFEYLRPIRSPNKNLQPPLELYDELRQMRAIASGSGARVSVDQDGREVCDSAEWQQARARAQIKATRMGGYLAVVGQDSGDAADRALAYYGAYWIETIQDTISIMALIAGEPVPQIREEAMQRALAFLRVQIGKNRGGGSGPRGASPVEFGEGRAIGQRVYDDPDAPAYDLDINPWCALVACEQARDQAQGLWFLRELVLLRKQYGAESIALIQGLLPALVVHKEPEVRKQAHAYLAAIDPRKRPVPAEGMPNEAVLAWLDAVIYDLFPPIRRVSAGLYDLYPSADLAQIVATGKDLLARDAIGSTASGTVGGVFYRGFKVLRQPTPLDLLGLPKDAVITSINGAPVTDSKSLLATLTTILGNKRSLMVEFVANERQKAIEYRLK